MILSGILMQFLGPKKSLVFNFSLSLLGMILMLVFWTETDKLIIFIFMGKFGFSAAINIIYIVFVTLLPSIYNTTAFGYCNVGTRIVSALSPIVANLDYPTPMVCALVALTAAILAALLMIEKMPKFI